MELLVCLADVTLGGGLGDAEDLVVIGDSCRRDERISMSLWGSTKSGQVTHTFLVVKCQTQLSCSIVS